MQTFLHVSSDLPQRYYVNQAEMPHPADDIYLKNIKCFSNFILEAQHLEKINNLQTSTDLRHSGATYMDVTIT